MAPYMTTSSGSGARIAKEHAGGRQAEPVRARVLPVVRIAVIAGCVVGLGCWLWLASWQGLTEIFLLAGCRAAAAGGAVCVGRREWAVEAPAPVHSSVAGLLLCAFLVRRIWLTVQFTWRLENESWTQAQAA